MEITEVRGGTIVERGQTTGFDAVHLEVSDGQDGPAGAGVRPA